MTATKKGRVKQIGVWQLKPGESQGTVTLRGTIKRRVLAATFSERHGVCSEMRPIERDVVEFAPGRWAQVEWSRLDDGGTIILDGLTELPKDLVRVPCETCGR